MRVFAEVSAEGVGRRVDAALQQEGLLVPAAKRVGGCLRCVWAVRPRLDCESPIYRAWS